MEVDRNMIRITDLSEDVGELARKTLGDLPLGVSTSDNDTILHTRNEGHRVITKPIKGNVTYSGEGLIDRNRYNVKQEDSHLSVKNAVDPAASQLEFEFYCSP